MRNLIVSLILVIFITGSYQWIYIGSLSKTTINNKLESEQSKELVIMLMSKIYERKPSCRKAFFDIEENPEDTDKIDVFAVCNTWEI